MKFNRKQQKGFSLIELLVVVAIMLVIAAIAVPSLLAAKRNANDASAIQGLRQIDNAELGFSNAYQQGYAPLAILGGTAVVCAAGASVTNGCLLDNALASTGTKSGYNFVATPITGTAAVPPSFWATAIPGTAGTTGNNSYCTMSDNVVRLLVGGGAIASAAACEALPPINSTVTN